MTLLHASATLLYSPFPTIASIAAPNAGPSFDWITSTLTFKISAKSWHQNVLFEPPPVIFTCLILIPNCITESNASFNANETPSTTALAKLYFVCDKLSPKNTPLAYESLIEALSPERYGKK